MTDALGTAVAGLAAFAAFVYALSQIFVSEKTCKARQGCVEAQIAGLRECVEEKFKVVTKLLEKLISRDGTG